MREIQEIQVLLHLLLHKADDEEAHPSSPGRAALPNSRNGDDRQEEAGNRAASRWIFPGFFEPMLCVTHHFLEPHSCFHSRGVPEC